MAEPGSFIHAYADRLSVPQGGGIGFCVSTGLPSFEMEIARLGARRQVVWTRGGIPGGEHPVPTDASERGCGWPVSFAVPVGADWPSGYYHALLRGEDGAGNQVRGEAAFVVRSARPGRDAAILLQRPTNTEAAYNSWGGSTFYNGPQGPARRLSFERPFAGFPGTERFRFTVSGEFAADLDRRIVPEALAEEMAAGGVEVTPWRGVDVERPGERWHILDVGFLSTLVRRGDRLAVFDGFSTWASCWHHWERHFVAWAEAAGYAIDYAVNGDLESNPELLEGYRLVLSVGHDEYWTAPMRDSLERFVEAGGNAAFFSGNVSWWQVRSEEEGRALVCWKDEMERDPHFASGDHATLSTLWCHRLIGRPENQLTGVSFAYGGYHGFFSGTPQTGAYTVHRPGHWMFAGDRTRTGGPARGEGPDRQLRVRRLRVRAGRRPAGPDLPRRHPGHLRDPRHRARFPERRRRLDRHGFRGDLRPRRREAADRGRRRPGRLQPRGNRGDDGVHGLVHGAEGGRSRGGPHHPAISWTGCRLRWGLRAVGAGGFPGT